MLNIAKVRTQIDVAKRNELLNKHPFAIWLGKDGNWHTYLPDKKKGRVPRKSKSKEKLEDTIVEFWKQQIKDPTVNDIFDEWLNGKLKRNEISKATWDRYKRQFDECCSEFGQRKVKDIDECDIKDYILDTIITKQLTVKGYGNLRTLLYGIFRRAKDKGLIQYSITNTIRDLEVSRKIFRKDVKPDEDLVFSEIETNEIINYLINKERDIIDLGILLLFRSGLRPGELVALKKCDITENSIYVNRTEIRYKGDGGKEIYQVRNSPKTNAGIRTVIIPSSYSWIFKEIKKINPFGEFLFERKGERLKSYHISQRLETICNRLKIKVRSPNKIRKTYGTILIDENVSEAIIISQMGHTNIKTTKRYYYKNRKNMEEKSEIIDKVVGLQ